MSEAEAQTVKARIQNQKGLHARAAAKFVKVANAYDADIRVVKGETDHYDHVCREAMAGLTNVALQFGLCLGNGLLTVHTEQQAIDRASPDGHNKGAEAAAAALVQIRAARWLGAV